MKDFRYDLKFALADFLIFAENERNHKEENEKSPFHAHTLKKRLFVCRTGKKLRKISKRLQDINDNAKAGTRPTFMDSIHLPGEFPCFDASRFMGSISIFEKWKHCSSNHLLKMASGNWYGWDGWFRKNSPCPTAVPLPISWGFAGNGPFMIK